MQCLFFFATKKNKEPFVRYKKLFAFANIASILVVGLISAYLQRSFIELLAVMGALLQTGGLWCESEQTIRKFGLLSAPFWLCYNYISKAYGAALGSVIAIISVVVSLVRYRETKNKNEEENFEVI